MIRFSVCLPVRNGWPYVQECVESILSQTYSHFDLHIMDNQSTDETRSWLATLKDPRVRVCSSSTPLSIVDSWARIASIEKQEFMTLIGHDDVLDPEYLSVMKRLIERHPDAGLYLTGGRFIDSNGHRLRNCRPVPARETAAEYLAARLTFQRDVFGTGYVMRSADYDALGGIPAFEKLFFADDALWLSLIKGTYKATDPSEQFGVRIHPGSESASLPAVWPSILRALRQFNQFLNVYIRDDTTSRRVFEEHAPSFMLTYHRNAYIFALIEASQGGNRVAPEVIHKVRESLSLCAPATESMLTRSVKLAVIAALNYLPARRAVPRLWDVYYRLKNTGRRTK